MAKQDDIPRDDEATTDLETDGATHEGGDVSGLTPSVAQFATAGLQFAIGILAFLFLGDYLDRRLGTAPWLVVVGAFLGAAAGFFALYRKLTNARKRIAERRFHHSAHH